MTIKESRKGLKAYKDLQNLIYYRSNNLTNKQRDKLYDILSYLREMSEKAYRQSIKLKIESEKNQ